MKRLLTLLLVFALMSGLLAACTSQDPPATSSHISVQNPSDSPSVPSSVPTVPATNPTEPVQPPQPDFFTRYGQGVPASDQVPDYAQATDTPNLYALPLDMPEAYSVRRIATCGSILYVCYSSHCLRTYDITTGTTLYDITFPDGSDFGPLDNGGAWVLHYLSMSVYLYDSEGQCTIVSLDFNTQELYTICDICIDPSGQYLVLVCEGEMPIQLYDLHTGAVSSPEITQCAPIYAAKYHQNRFVLYNYDGDIYLMDPVTGDWEYIHAESPWSEFYDGICYNIQEGGMSFSGLNGDSTSCFLALPACWLNDLSHGCAALGSYDAGPMIHVLDLRKQIALADIAFSQDCFGTISLFLDNGSLLVLAMEDSGNSLYLFDTDATPTDPMPINAFICTPQELEAETVKIAQTVRDTTGIELLYGSQGNDFIFGDYVGVVELEPFHNFLAVSSVAQILSQYPDGMLREAWEYNFDGMKIYLCGSIYGIFAGTLDTAGGVTAPYDNYAVIALDINNPIETVLPHELAHVFDWRIASMSEQMDWFAIWESIHPMSNPYTYSYDGYDDYIKYTPFGEDNPEKVWFVDSYARTFATEDRARIMEMLFRGANTPDPCLEYVHILEKARLYCYILRQCFPSCNVEEPLFWERFLGVIDQSVLP